MYKKEIKVLDCTVRDGGLMNKWQFTDEFVKAVYQSCVDAGIDYMEIGYKSSEKAFDRNEVGCWKFCHEDDLRRIVGDNNTSLKLAAMADIGRIEPEDIPDAGDSVLDMIRVAAYVHQMDKAIWLAEHCMDKGYEVTINLMAVSTAMEKDLEEALSDVANSRVPVFYLVDSFGSMGMEQIEHLMKKYIKYLPGKTIGMHMHNNMQMAFSNTVTGIINGSRMLDATMLGIGRGAGNCNMEILLSFLKNPKYKLRPVLELIQNYLYPLREQIDWGYHLPYMLTGALNQHPRAGMKWMESDQKEDVMGFFNQLSDKNDL